MSQARVTDFFSQRKKSSVEGANVTRGKGHKLAQQTSVSVGNGFPGVTALPPSVKPKARSKNTEIIAKNRSTRSANSVHEEFLRVVDEAIAVGQEDTGVFLKPNSTETSKGFPPSPRTPKRTAAEAEFDLGAALFSATADHSTAKKRQRLEASKRANDNVTSKEHVEKAVKKTARKKLILPQDNVQVRN